MKLPGALLLGLSAGLAAACLAGSGVRGDEWYGQHLVLLQDWEKKIYARLSPEGRLRFQTLFWDSRDEDSQLEFWDRLEYVRTVYKIESARNPWSTDRGRVYLLNGPPQEISFQALPGIRPLYSNDPGYDDALGIATEVWSYYYRNRFVRYIFTGRRLQQQVYLNTDVRNLENENRQAYFGIAIEPEEYRNEVIALLEKFRR